MRISLAPRGLGLAIACCLATALTPCIAAASYLTATIAIQARKHGLLFNAHASNGGAQPDGIDVYVQYSGFSKRKPIAEITDGVVGPIAICTDPTGTLYVSNFDQATSKSSITVYPPGETSPSVTYTKDISYAWHIAVGPDGSLYASNANTDTIVQCPPGTQMPGRKISFHGARQSGIALDPANNLYVVTQTGDIERFNPNSGKGESLGFNLGGATQLGFDANGNFAANISGGLGLGIFSHAPPYQQIAAYNFSETNPGPFAFTADGSYHYAADPTEGRLVQIAYPQGNFSNVQDIVGITQGIAVTPPVLP